MRRLRDVIPPKPLLEGRKVPMDSVLNVPLVFTGWSILPSRREPGTEYIILQFERDGGRYVVMTGGAFLIKDVRAYEEQAGKEPFEATVVKRGKAYFFA